MWSINNKMNSHSKKCKAVAINHKPSSLPMLPFVAYHYNLGENLLEYADSERDLGVDITSNFIYNEHCDRIISRANQKLGMLRRTCNFVNDVKRRRIGYKFIRWDNLVFMADMSSQYGLKVMGTICSK